MRLHVKCLLGLHDWGDWDYKFDRSCIQVRMCKRECSKKAVQERISHDWGEWQSCGPESPNGYFIRKCNRDAFEQIKYVGEGRETVQSRYRDRSAEEEDQAQVCDL